MCYENNETLKLLQSQIGNVEQQVETLKQQNKLLLKTIEELRNILLYSPPKQGTEFSKAQNRFDNTVTATTIPPVKGKNVRRSNRKSREGNRTTESDVANLCE